MSIFIDSRIGSKDLIRHVPLDSLGTLTRLESADLCFSGKSQHGPVLIGIEVKSIFDLISSSNTGRLQATQIPAMLSTYDISWLVVYGIYRPSPDDQSLQILKGKFWQNYQIGSRVIPFGFVESFLLTLTALGVHVKRVNSLEECAVWCGCLYRWWQKEWKDHNGMRTFDNSVRDVSLMPGMDSETAFKSSIAQKLPGVGFERAIAVGQYFGSVEEMMTADIDEWVKIPGIGKTIAKAIVSKVRKKKETDK